MQFLKLLVHLILIRFAIPFMFSTTLGLSAVALRDDPAMRVLSPEDVSAGLPAPSAAAALLGKGGAAALLVVLFLAVTSATSAELIAVSSILTFDIYKVISSSAIWHFLFAKTLLQ
jgi:urea-proton symporter